MRKTVIIDDDVDKAIKMFMSRFLELGKEIKYSRALNTLIRAALTLVADMRMTDVIPPKAPDKLSEKLIRDAIDKILEVAAYDSRKEE